MLRRGVLQRAAEAYGPTHPAMHWASGLWDWLQRVSAPGPGLGCPLTMLLPASVTFRPCGLVSRAGNGDWNEKFKLQGNFSGL